VFITVSGKQTAASGNVTRSLCEIHEMAKIDLEILTDLVANSEVEKISAPLGKKAE